MIESNNTGDTQANTNAATNGSLVRVQAEAVLLQGLLNVPANARGMVILAHGIDTNHQHTLIHSQIFHDQGLATLVMDLFSSAEQQLDEESGYFRNNTEIMQQRLLGAAEWLLEKNTETQNLAVGIFGVGVIGTAALIAAAERPDLFKALIVAGASDLPQDYLRRIMSPTLFIAAEQDAASMKATQEALELIVTDKQFEQVAGTNTLTEGEAIDKVAQLGQEWFSRWLVPIV